MRTQIFRALQALKSRTWGQRAGRLCLVGRGKAWGRRPQGACSLQRLWPEGREVGFSMSFRELNLRGREDCKRLLICFTKKARRQLHHRGPDTEKVLWWAQWEVTCFRHWQLQESSVFSQCKWCELGKTERETSLGGKRKQRGTTLSHRGSLSSGTMSCSVLWIPKPADLVTNMCWANKDWQVAWRP